MAFYLDGQGEARRFTSRRPRPRLMATGRYFMDWEDIAEAFADALLAGSVLLVIVARLRRPRRGLFG